MDDIDGENPNPIRMLAAQGRSIEDIAGMTQTELDFVGGVLMQPVSEEGTPKSVNTTSDPE